MAIGILTLLFVAISLISLIGILLLFLWKEGSGKEALFYLLAVWGLLAFLKASDERTYAVSKAHLR